MNLADKNIYLLFTLLKIWKCSLASRGFCSRVIDNEVSQPPTTTAITPLLETP
jgi:hypothetical protein